MKETTIHKLIELKRKLLGETQKVFGERFGVANSTVSLWESGDREAPYKVIEFCIQTPTKYDLCDKCNGSGFIETKEEITS